jgi:predicted Rossmann fold flavoprotein
MPGFDVIVVGAGPAGLMAAGQAASLGKKTLLLEKMDQPGRKLLLTGKHRCNLTNTAPIEEALAHFNPGGRFLTQLFYHFYTDELRDFFQELGVKTVVQRGGRIFPESEKASDVLDALISWNRSLGVTTRVGTPAKKLLINENRTTGIESDEDCFRGDSIIIATGGKAYPGTGSTGDGYSLAEQAGHKIITPKPALVPLITKSDLPKKIQGLSLRNVLAKTFVNDKYEYQLFGELIFTHFGLSGPVILTLSREIVKALEAGEKVEITIDLKPALDQKKLDLRLLREIERLGKKQVKTFLAELLPKKLIPICIDQTGIPGDKKVSQLTSTDRKQLIKWMKDDFRFVITEHAGFSQAIITSGGVDTNQVKPSTMESKLIQGLYFAGEVLDIDADTGGYNLQAAFSTGWAAGRAAASTSG